jgi:CRISPR-associated protein Cas2
LELGDEFMMVLITYDVNTETEEGKKRLRKVAKQCQNYGQRVQNSVFECVLDPGMFKQLQNKLEKIIDIEKDSIRYYYMGDEWRKRVEHIGAKASLDIEGTLIV